MERIAAACEAEGALEVQVARDEAEAARILEARRAALPSLSRLGRVTLLEDATVPRSQIAAMVERIEQAAARHDLRIGTFGHAGDGNLHPTVRAARPTTTTAVERAHRAFAEIFSAAIELGGTITGEHGVGLAKLPFLEQRLGRRARGAAAADQARLRPAGHPQPGQAGLVTADRAASSPRSCSTAASRAASACPPARPTRAPASRRPRRAAGST